MNDYVRLAIDKYGCLAMKTIVVYVMYCVKSVRIRSYSGPYFPALGVTRITPNTDTFHAVMLM